jgi:prevent-host-death family protein
MIEVNVFEIKAKLSEYIRLVERGQSIVICRRNKPIAELRPMAAARREPRPIGGAKGQFEVDAAFFEPLPDDIVEAFSATAPETAPLKTKAPHRRRGLPASSEPLKRR